MSVSIKGFNENCATFKVAGDVKAGAPVKISENYTVSACAAGDSFAGILVNSKDGYGCVQLSGEMKLPYSGDSAPALGCTILSADGKDGVKTDSKGRSVLVAAIDTADKTADIIL